MIRYRLRCDQDHTFEAWFKGSAGFDAQSRKGAVACPICGTTAIAKAPMAPSVVGGRGEAEPAPARERPAGEPAEQIVEAFRRMRKQVERTCDYVGDTFPEEARRIHYGEKGARGIYGEATPDEARRLDEEGIEVFPLPKLPRRDG